MPDVDLENHCTLCGSLDGQPCGISFAMRATLCPRETEALPPTFTISATDHDAPALLRSFAAKIRVTNQERAREIEETATRFDAWRRRSLRR